MSEASRLVFVSALLCAAVMSFIMCSDAARATPTTTPVRHVLRRLYTPRGQHHHLLSAETGLQTGTETSSIHRGATSIIDHQSNPLLFTAGSFSDNQNSLARITRVQSEVKPASSSYNSYPAIIRKSSLNEAPFHQSSKVWDPKDAQKSYIKEKVPQSHSGRYSSSSPPTSRGHYSGYKETNELAAAGVPNPSSGIQSSKFHSFATQTALHAPSISDSSHASVIKSFPSPEKPTPSITDFSQGLPRLKNVQSYLFKDDRQTASVTQAYSWFSPSFQQNPSKEVQSLSKKYQNTKVTQYGAQADSKKQQIPNATMERSVPRPPVADFQGSKKPVIKSFPSPEKPTPSITDFSQGLQRLKNIQPYLFKDDQQTASVTQVYSWFSPSFLQKPSKEVQSLSKKYQNTKVTQNGAQADTKNQQIPDATMERSVPRPLADFQGSKKPAISSFVDTTTRGSTHPYKPGQKTKSIYGFKGFERPTWRTSGGSNGRTDSQRYSFNEGKGRKIATLYPSLTRKYSFSQREAAKLERTTTQPPSSRPFTSGFKDQRDANNQFRPRFKVSKRIPGLNRLRPLEGARVQQGFQGFKKPGNSQIWQPKNNHVSTVSEDLKAGSTKSRFIPEKYKTRPKIYSFLGFQPVQNTASNKALKQNHTKAPPSHVISSSYFRSAGKPKVESGPKSEPRTQKESVEIEARPLNRFTSSTVRGKPVKGNVKKKLYESSFSDVKAAIVRLPRPPAKIVAIAYADIVGSASFSGVKATTQTPVIAADKDYHPNTTEEEADHLTLKSEDQIISKENTSRGLEDFSEENKPSVRSKEVPNDVQTSDFFLDNEGSGSGGFNLSDVLPTDTAKSWQLSEDSLELDYLRISTGNISFKSMNVNK